MADLCRRLENNDNTQLLHWVIPEQLACAHRPLRHHPHYGGSGKNLVRSATSLVFDWAEKIQISGIKSIISLMHDRDLQCYDAIDLGTPNLLEFYRKLGFQVFHIPWEDPHHKRSLQTEKEKTLLNVRQKALYAYDELSKPVLIQCSAGIDRSSPVAAFIWVRRAS